MQAGFLCKKILKIFISGCGFIIVTFCLAYAYTLYHADVVRMDRQFSFVVREYESVDVGVFETEQIGGAGYALSLDGKDYVAVNVYNSVSVAERVQTTLGDAYAVHTVKLNDLYFSTRREKRNAEVYIGAFSSLDGCIQVLSQEIERLDTGATQQSSKRVLTLLKRQLSYLSATYAQSYPRFSKVCEKTVLALERETEEIVYAQQLRYVLCSLCVDYSQLTRQFLP